MNTYIPQIMTIKKQACDNFVSRKFNCYLPLQLINFNIIQKISQFSQCFLFHISLIAHTHIFTNLNNCKITTCIFFAYFIIPLINLPISLPMQFEHNSSLVWSYRLIINQITSGNLKYLQIRISSSMIAGTTFDNSQYRWKFLFVKNNNNQVFNQERLLKFFENDK